jgi:hypothetical protein
MSDENYHRTYPPLTMKGGGYFPSEHMDAREKTFLKAGARRAWVLNARMTLDPVVIHVKKDQSFASQATGWELAFSKLVALSNRADPVISEDGAVVGHLGWFPGDWVLKPKGLDPGDIKSHLDNNVSLFVLNNNPLKHFFDAYGMGINSYYLLTTVDGLVIAHLGSKSADGVESVWYSPMDMLAAGKILITVGKAGARLAVKALGRRGKLRISGNGATGDAAKTSLANAAGAATTRRTGSMTVDEMERYLIAIMQERRELGRLYGAYARGLGGEPLKREVLDILRQWEKSYGRSVKFVEKGVVQKATVKGNLMTLKDDLLIIEKHVLDDPKLFFKEVVHELAADALRVRGQGISPSQLAFIGVEFQRGNSAFFILEHALMTKGGLKTIMASYRR